MVVRVSHRGHALTKGVKQPIVLQNAFTALSLLNLVGGLWLGVGSLFWPSCQNKALVAAVLWPCALHFAYLTVKRRRSDRVSAASPSVSLVMASVLRMQWECCQSQLSASRPDPC